MKKNIGSTDRVIRYCIAVVILILHFNDLLSGAFASILPIVSGALIITSFISYSPIYPLFGINTRKIEKIEQDIEANS